MITKTHNLCRCDYRNDFILYRYNAAKILLYGIVLLYYFLCCVSRDEFVIVSCLCWFRYLCAYKGEKYYCHVHFGCAWQYRNSWPGYASNNSVKAEIKWDLLTRKVFQNHSFWFAKARRGSWYEPNPKNVASSMPLCHLTAFLRLWVLFQEGGLLSLLGLIASWARGSLDNLACCTMRMGPITSTRFDLRSDFRLWEDFFVLKKLKK